MKSYIDIDEAYKKVAVRFGSNVADEIFLKESEDERIRKFLIGYFDKLVDENSEWGLEQETRNKIVAWLEKQGEQQPAECDILSAKKGDMLSNGTIVLIVDSIAEFEGKPIINSWYFADSEKFYGKGTSECDRWAVGGFRTATEAECNYLLKMMSDAGYEWDAEKKELKKIIDEKQIKKNLQDNSFRRMFEQKSVWDEEDERNLDWLMTVCERIHYKSDPQVAPYSALMLKDWLRTLKDRVQPKQ